MWVSGDLNSGLHSGTASALTTELSSWPLTLFLLRPDCSVAQTGFPLRVTLTQPAGVVVCAPTSGIDHVGDT